MKVRRKAAVKPVGGRPVRSAAALGNQGAFGVPGVAPVIRKPALRAGGDRSSKWPIGGGAVAPRWP